MLRTKQHLAPNVLKGSYFGVGLDSPTGDSGRQRGCNRAHGGGILQIRRNLARDVQRRQSWPLRSSISSVIFSIHSVSRLPSQRRLASQLTLISLFPGRQAPSHGFSPAGRRETIKLTTSCRPLDESTVRKHPVTRFRATATVTRLATGAILCAAALLPLAASAQTTTQRTAPAVAPSAKSARTASPTTAVPTPVASPPSADVVLHHLHETVTWYHTIETIAQNSDLSDGTRTRDGMRSSALAALRSAFDFARAAARMVDAAPHGAVPNASTSDTSDDAVRLDRAATRIGARMDTIQNRIAAIDSSLAHATPPARRTLTAQRAEAVAALDLAREVQSTVTQLQQFAVSAAAHGGGTAGTLTSQVEEIEHTMPELRDNSTGGSGANDSVAPNASSATGRARTRNDTAGSAAIAPSAPSASESSVQSSSGLVALVGEWLALKRIQHEFDAAIRQTDNLGGELDSMRTRVSSQVRTLVRLHANPLDSASVDPQQLLATQLQLQNATAQFKELATLVVPLSEQDISTDDARNSLVLLRGTFDARSDTVR